METHATFPNRTLLLVALTGALAVPSLAAAQPAPPAPPGQPVAPAAAPMPFQMPAAAADPIALALAPKTGGLTAEETAKVVSRTKHSVRSKQEDLKAAAAKVDQAFVGFFPRLSLSATYTRLSPVPAFSLGNLVGTSIAAPQGLGTVPADTTVPNGGTVKVPASLGLPGNAIPCMSPGGCSANYYALNAGFPATPVNSTQLVASVSVPVSDYVFRLAQGYASASHKEKGARYAAEAEALQAGADAKIAYFNWVQAKGGVVVATEAIAQSKAHLEDAKKSFAVGLASRADVLRIDAQVAAAQQGLAESIAFASIAEEQLRVLLGAPADKGLEIGTDVMNDPALPPADTLQALQEQAMGRRLELRSLDEAISSLRQVESLTKASYAPRLDAFADATYANPNQRIFPATQTWAGTWDIGARLSWTLNDTFTTIGAGAEAKARVASAMEQRAALQDGLRIEVASAYADTVKAPPAIEAADRGMVSAEESLRVRRELFRNGKATSSELVDAEAELTSARLRRLNAHVGQLVARAKLDHATGRDAPAKPVSE